MKIAPTDPPEVAAAVAMTAQDEEKAMTISHMDVIHDQAMVIVIVTAHDPVLQKAETSPLRSTIRTKSHITPNLIYDWGLFLPNLAPK